MKRENIKRLNHNHPRNLQPVSVINSALLVEQSEEDDAGKGCSSGDPNSLDEGRNKCNLDMGESGKQILLSLRLSSFWHEPHFFIYKGTGDNGQLYDGDGSDSSCDTSDQPEECGTSGFLQNLEYFSTNGQLSSMILAYRTTRSMGWRTAQAYGYRQV